MFSTYYLFFINKWFNAIDNEKNISANSFVEKTHFMEINFILMLFVNNITLAQKWVNYHHFTYDNKNKES